MTKKLKLVDIAKVLNVSGGRITHLKKMGMPTDSIDAAAAWYRQNISQKHSPKQAGTVPPAAETMAAIAAEVFDIQKDRAKLAHFEAHRSELKFRQECGELVDASRVRRVITAWSAQARSALERIPDKLSDRLAAEIDPAACHALMTTEIDLVLADLAAAALGMKFE